MHVRPSCLVGTTEIRAPRSRSPVPHWMAVPDHCSFNRMDAAMTNSALNHGTVTQPPCDHRHGQELNSKNHLVDSWCPWFEVCELNSATKFWILVMRYASACKAGKEWTPSLTRTINPLQSSHIPCIPLRQELNQGTFASAEAFTLSFAARFLKLLPPLFPRGWFMASAYSKIPFHGGRNIIVHGKRI